MFSHRLRGAVLPLLLLCSLAPSARADYVPAPRGGEMKKADEVLARLRRLEEAAATPDDFRAFGALVREFYPALASKAAGLPEGFLKTDLLTAAIFYEAAYEARRTAALPAPVCERELRDDYRKSCLENRSGDRAQFLRAKARLHTRRAEATLRYMRGERDAETLRALTSVRAARELDAALANRAVAALKTLAARLDALAPREETEDVRTESSLHPGQLSDSFSQTFATVDGVLASLPRGRVYNLIRNARNSYRDGLYWSGKTLQRRSRVVSVNSLDAPDELAALRLPLSSVDNTVLGNWRGARRFTRKAEEAIAALNR